MQTQATMEKIHEYSWLAKVIVHVPWLISRIRRSVIKGIHNGGVAVRGVKLLIPINGVYLNVSGNVSLEQIAKRMHAGWWRWRRIFIFFLLLLQFLFPELLQNLYDVLVDRDTGLKLKNGLIKCGIRYRGNGGSLQIYPAPVLTERDTAVFWRSL